MTRRARRGAWALLALVVGVALAVGARPDGPPAGAAARIRHLDAEIGCPSCVDLSVGQSDAASALTIRALVRQEVLAGRSDAAILAALKASYGASILLSPPDRGITATVWLLPAVALGAALAGMALVFRRRRARAPATGDSDRRLVEEALAARGRESAEVAGGTRA